MAECRQRPKGESGKEDYPFNDSAVKRKRFFPARRSPESLQCLGSLTVEMFSSRRVLG